MDYFKSGFFIYTKKYYRHTNIEYTYDLCVCKDFDPQLNYIAIHRSFTVSQY